MERATSKQAKSLSKEATRMYEAKEQLKLIELLDSVSPMVAVLINIQISLVNS